ncbi:MAG: SUMF1/EgtB/PvdO family nonheme iron enzyme, partial [bacterium]
TPGMDTPGMDTPGMDTPGMDTPGMDTPGMLGGMDKPGMDTPGMKTGEPALKKDPTKSMILVKGGKFTMGREDGSKTEAPPQKGIEVGDFYLDPTEVSRAQYARYLAGPGRKARSPWATRTPPPPTDLPVTSITWTEAGAYCRALGKRLPSEPEWEYAARGAEHRHLYPWGDKFDAEKVVSSVTKPSELQPVRSGSAVGGFYHLVGNAWEWVADRYKPYKGSKAGKAFGTQYVIRGGGAETKKANQLTATYRVFNYGHENPKSKKLAVYRFLGFRCAHDAKK